MKKYIEDNSKIIIVCSVVVVAVAKVAYVGMSYGAGNSPIYTRDELSEKVDNLEYDTGWVSLIPYIDPAFTYQDSRPPHIRRIGNVVYLRGAITGNTLEHGTTKTFIGGIPKIFRPSVNVVSSNAVGGFKAGSTYRLGITKYGDIGSSANSYGTLTNETLLYLDCVYFVN